MGLIPLKSSDGWTVELLPGNFISLYMRNRLFWEEECLWKCATKVSMKSLTLVVLFIFSAYANAFAQPTTILQTKSTSSQTRIASGKPTIIFANEARVTFNHSNLKPFKLKSWSDSEKRAVTLVIDRLAARAPEFVKLVESNTPLKFVRASEVIADGIPTMAVTLDDAIVLPDQFFKSPGDQFHILVHELVHQSDFYWYVSHSRGWVMFAHPKLAESKTQSQVSRPNWVTEQARCNLVEALAEYVTFGLESPADYVTDSADRAILSEILHPSQKHLFWNRCMSKGAALLAGGKVVLAREEFARAIAIAPDAATAYMYAGIAEARRGNVGSAAAMMTKFLAITDAAAVSESEHVRYQALNRVVEGFAAKAQRKAFVAGLIKSSPGDKAVRDFAKQMNTRD